MAWDYFHINSITKGDDRHYLLSARHVSTIYKINGTDVTVIWRLGGERSNFVLGPNTTFGFQHHARYVEVGTGSLEEISLFDNPYTAQKLEEAATKRSICTLSHGASISGLTTNQRGQP